MSMYAEPTFESEFPYMKQRILLQWVDHRLDKFKEVDAKMVRDMSYLYDTIVEEGSTHRNHRRKEQKPTLEVDNSDVKT